jgi:hypothetical protein
MFGHRRYFRALLAGSEEGIASNILSSVAEGSVTSEAPSSVSTIQLYPEP